MHLFEDNGAEFSECGKYRYLLWRIWDKQKPMVMFIGLNPSTANADTDDNTIKRIRAIARNLGYGGIYMTNCFPFISTDPDKLNEFGNTAYNDHVLYTTSQKAKDVVFAWGAFRIVQKLGRDTELKGMFPNAKALKLTKHGQPWHPLFIAAKTQLIDYGKP